MNQFKANLFVVGAMKAGTTSFNEMLSSHPSIYFSAIKEPHYFVDELPKRIHDPSRFFSIEDYFKNKFPEKLHIAQLKEKKHFEKLFSLVPEEAKYCAEGSTGYFHANESAQKIYEYNPEAKIIVVLRDPLKRAYSHYKMDVGFGRTIKTFEEEIAKEINDYESGKLSNWGYIGMSLYYENCLRYRALFGSNFLIVNFEQLAKDKEIASKRVYDFLGIESINIDVPHNNSSSDIKYQKLVYYLKKMGVKDFFSLLLPQKLRHSIFKLISHSEPKSLELNDELRLKLNSIFEKDQELMKSIL